MKKITLFLSFMLLSLTALAQAPGCAANPFPVDADATTLPGTITFTWDEVEGASGYDFYAGDSPDTLELLDTFFTNTTGEDLALQAYNTTIYWQIIAYNDDGEAVGCDVWSFTTIASPGYCLTSPYDQYPLTAFTPETCDGVTENSITTIAYAGEYSVVNVVADQPYVFKSGLTDFITISTDDGETAEIYGVTPLSWTSTVTGTVRFYSHVDDQCGTEDENRTRSIICGTTSADVLDYYGLQYPGSATIVQDESVTVYGQVYEAGLTNVEPGYSGQGEGVQAWVGISTVDTDPATWSTSAWSIASHDAGFIGNNDQYMAQIGAGLEPGTYYFATRFRLNDGAYVYGGFNDDDPANTYGQIWNGTSQTSGVLTITPAPAPANDECIDAIALEVGNSFETGAITATNLNATEDDLEPTCQDDYEKNVWFTVVVPESGDLTIETSEVSSSLLSDSIISVYSGTCDALTPVDCNDDNEDDWDTLMSKVDLSGRTPGETLYISVWIYGGGDSGQFRVSAYDVNLSVGNSQTTKLSYFPNPVQDILNFSTTANDISNVQVFNILGQQVATKSGAAIKEINMSALAAGTYIVKVTANNEVKTIKVIKS